MAILITGAAGFIGFHLAKSLLEQGHNIIGIDNINDYYDIKLKYARLEILQKYDNFEFIKADISDKDTILSLADSHKQIEYIIHLAAQAGVRYSLENPFAYVTSNVMGHVVMLEMARSLPNLRHFIYASSSSVYGGNKKMPFSVKDDVNQTVSLYAATKRSDELITNTYCHLYGIAATGLRFFTVYGPWGRPDMAYYLFTKAIISRESIKVFDNGNMMRDFTYIDDIISGIHGVMEHIPTIGNSMFSKHDIAHNIYNLGNHKAEKLMDFIKVLEDAIGKEAVKEFYPRPKGDVPATYADIEASEQDFGFSPKTPISEGLPKFVAWYRDYYGV